MQHLKIEEKLAEYNGILKENDNIYRGIAKVFGLSECAFWILYILRTEHGVLTQKNICEAMYHPKQTVNSALKNLETDGYIELFHSHDRRSKEIKLTPKGIRLAEDTADRIILAEQQAILALTEAEQDTFLLLFHKYTESLKQQVIHLEPGVQGE